MHSFHYFVLFFCHHALSSYYWSKSKREIVQKFFWKSKLSQILLKQIHLEPGEFKKRILEPVLGSVFKNLVCCRFLRTLFKMMLRPTEEEKNKRRLFKVCQRLSDIELLKFNQYDHWITERKRNLDWQGGGGGYASFHDTDLDSQVFTLYNSWWTERTEYGLGIK